MKPLRLTLRGINSYRKEQTIDFATLTSAGLFGIFGPTGSGKSSILDAITLALYAKLPRSTKNFININEQTAAVSFTFSITTTQTHIYQVERSFRYHKNNTAFTVRNTTGILTEITTESPVILADRPTEVTQECIRLLGLTSEDFMRTVVLPQGQFSEFLKLKNAERRSMLQRLFHLEKYGQELTQKITYARQKQELLLSSLEGQLQSFLSFTEETLTVQEKQQQQLILEEKRTEQKKVEAETSFKEADAIRTLLSEYEPAKKEYERYLAKKTAMDETEKRLESGKQANQLRPFAIQAKQANEYYEKATTDFHIAKNAYETNFAHYKKLQEEKNEIFQEYEIKFPQLLQQEQQFSTALERCSSLQNWERKKIETEQKRKTAEEQLLLFSQQEKQLLDKIEKQKEQIQQQEEIAAKIRPSHEEMAALEKGYVLEETYREKRKLFEEKKTSLHEQKQNIEAAQNSQKNYLERIRITKQRVSSCLQWLQQQLEETEHSITQIQEKKSQSSLLLEKLQKHHLALTLRNTLKDGDICPVCGSIHHETKKGKEEAALWNDSKELQEIQQAKESIKQQEQLETEFHNKKNHWEQQIALFSMNFQSLSSLCPEDDFDVSSIPTDFDFSPETRRNLLEKVQKLSSEYTAFQGQSTQLYAQYQQQTAIYKEQFTLLKQSLDEIHSLRAQWKTENFTEDLAQKRTLEKEYDRIQTTLFKDRKELDILTQQRESLSENILQLSGKISSCNHEILHYNTLILEEKGKFPDGLAIELDFSSLLSEVKSKRTQLEKKKTSIEKNYQIAEQELQTKKEQWTAADHQMRLSKQNKEQANDLFQEQLKQSPFSLDTPLESLYLSEEEIAESTKMLQIYQDQFMKAADRYHYLEEKRQNREISEEEWNQRKELLDTLTQHFHQLQKEEAVLSREIEIGRDKLKQKKRLEKDQERALHRRGIIRQLEQLFKGNSFIEYVAESRLKYIASEASVILSSISNGNYELDLNDSSEFMIRDNKNGGILRPCDTLSGGETFITSLSLALALSSTVQLNGSAPLELFFLDEGFGSLDDELLDVVMTSLERLQSRKRSIGIITHVEAIQERVPIKLVITPSDISQNGSSIHMEYS